MKFRLDQKDIAVAIDEDTGNFSRYIDPEDEKPCGPKKLKQMLAALNEQYAEELKGWTKLYFPESDKIPLSDIHPSKIQETIQDIKESLATIDSKITSQDIYIQALTALLLKYMAGKIPGKSIAGLTRELERTKRKLELERLHKADAKRNRSR